MMSRRLSGLQKEVLSLYRTLLREAQKKDTAEDVMAYCRKEFRKKSLDIPNKDFRTIEHNIRSGHKFVKLMKMPGFRFASGSK